MTQVKIYGNRQELNAGFTSFILRLLEGNEYIKVALSGGSTPKSLFDHWARQSATAIPWHKIHFYWGDERCVSPEDEMSNYGMTKRHLFDLVSIPEQNIHRIRGEDAPQQEAARYGTILPESFDLIILGLGDDGHTASIFPYNIRLWDSTEKCIVTAHPDSGMLRVSITGKVINAARKVAFLVAGKDKAEKTGEILRNRPAFIDRYPAARVNPESGELYWFIDREAAGDSQ